MRRLDYEDRVEFLVSLYLSLSLSLSATVTCRDAGNKDGSVTGLGELRGYVGASAW